MDSLVWENQRLRKHARGHPCFSPAFCSQKDFPFSSSFLLLFRILTLGQCSMHVESVTGCRNNVFSKKAARMQEKWNVSLLLDKMWKILMRNRQNLHDTMHLIANCTLSCGLTECMKMEFQFKFAAVTIQFMSDIFLMLIPLNGLSCLTKWICSNAGLVESSEIYWSVALDLLQTMF